jgi:hypothetical protein
MQHGGLSAFASLTLASLLRSSKWRSGGLGLDRLP